MYCRLIIGKTFIFVLTDNLITMNYELHKNGFHIIT